MLIDDETKKEIFQKLKSMGWTGGQSQMDIILDRLNTVFSESDQSFQERFLSDDSKPISDKVIEMLYRLASEYQSTQKTPHENINNERMKFVIDVDLNKANLQKPLMFFNRMDAEKITLIGNDKVFEDYITSIGLEVEVLPAGTEPEGLFLRALPHPPYFSN